MAPKKPQAQTGGLPFLEAKPGRGPYGKLGVSGGGVAKETKPRQEHQLKHEQHQRQSTTTSSCDVSREEAAEELLRSFDMNSKYGPCTGMTRLARWERAHRFGKAPPPEVKETLAELLKEQPGSIKNQCLWYGRV